MARADPWHRVRHAYITGTTGQRELAEKFGVSARELARRSAEEGWVDARAAFRARAAAKAIDRAVDDEADKLDAVRSVADTLAGQLASIMPRMTRNWRRAKCHRACRQPAVSLPGRNTG